MLDSDSDDNQTCSMAGGREETIILDSVSDKDPPCSKSGGLQCSMLKFLSQQTQVSPRTAASTPVAKSTSGLSSSVGASRATIRSKSTCPANLSPKIHTESKSSIHKCKILTCDSEDEEGSSDSSLHSLDPLQVGLHRKASWMDCDSAVGRCQLRRLSTVLHILLPKTFMQTSCLLQDAGFKQSSKTGSRLHKERVC